MSDFENNKFEDRKDADGRSASWTDGGWQDIIIAYRRLSRWEVAEIEALCNEKQVYDVEDIQRLLGIGRSRAYTYLDEVYQRQEPFRVIKIGKLFRVPKQSFDNWLNGIS